MEKFSSFEKVIGHIPEAEKKRILREIGEIFDDQKLDFLEEKEKEKTPEELEMITLANAVTNGLRREYGLDNFDIPPKNIHIIKEKDWSEGGISAAYNAMMQAVALPEQPAKISFIKQMIHELLHFKSYHALQATIEENPKIREFREGLIIYTRDGRKRFFSGLNEAVIEETAKRLTQQLFNHHLFKEELEQTKDVVKKYPEARTDSGEPLFGKDIYYAGVTSKESLKTAIGHIFRAREGTKEIKIMATGFTYSKEREILNMLIDKIFEKNSEKYKDKEEVFKVFVGGMMTGNILPLILLIDETFGRGTFKTLCEKDRNLSLREEFIKSL